MLRKREGILDTKKAGESSGLGSCRAKFSRRDNLLREQHIARVLDRTGDRALVLGRKASVFAGQNFAGVGDPAGHRLRLGERNFRWRWSLLLLFGRAHA